MHKVVQYVVVLLLLGGSVRGAPSVTEYNPRDPRFFFKVITIRPDPCTTTTGSTGICYTSADCTTAGGQALGTCALGLGVCCFVTNTCGSTITTNATSFVNPDPATTAQSCRATIDIQNQDICQIRLDYNTFDIKQPNVQGVCDQDFLMVMGASNDDLIPTICGYNTGQHMYFDVDPAGGNPSITIDTTGTDFTRDWDIQVSKIPCGATYAAPDGCLQYFTTTSGTVKSFNYETDPVLATDFANGTTTDVNLHLANQDYSVCIAPQDNYCSVIWSPTSDTSFITHQDPNGNPLIGMAGGVFDPFDVFADGTNEVCTDYVGLFGGVDDTGTSRDRYCGLAFPTEVTTTGMPQILYVRTNENEDNLSDNRNTGFSLDYRQMTC